MASSAEKRLIWLLRTYVILFSGAALSFYLIPDGLYSLMNAITQKIFPSLGLMTPITDRFWLSLSMSLMIVLVMICYWAQKDIQGRLLLVGALLVAKFSSTLFFFISFVMREQRGAYLIGLMADGLIFLVTYLFYQPVAQQLKNSHFERNPSKP